MDHLYKFAIATCDRLRDEKKNYIIWLDLYNLWLLAMDVSALASMKDAAYCDKQCDLQISEKH